MDNNRITEYGHHHEHAHSEHHHDHSGHVTPEILAQLEDKSDEAKQAKIDKIIGHTKELDNDPDLKYKKGIGYYYLEMYEECMREEAECYPFFDDEMGVAAIYWHTLAAFRSGKDPVLLNEKYHYGMDVGHHTAYNKALAAAKGILPLGSALKMLSFEHRPLEYSIFAYGIACYLQTIGRTEDADEMLKKIVADDRFWITYSYLAAWNEK